MTAHESHPHRPANMPRFSSELIDAYRQSPKGREARLTELYTLNPEIMKMVSEAAYAKAPLSKDGAVRNAMAEGALLLYGLFQSYYEAEELDRLLEHTTDAVDGVAQPPSGVPDDDQPADELFQAPPDL